MWRVQHAFMWVQYVRNMVGGDKRHSHISGGAKVKAVARQS